MMNITPFSPAERKALMEELFPLKRTARDYDLRQDMTLDGYMSIPSGPQSPSQERPIRAAVIADLSSS